MDKLQIKQISGKPAVKYGDIEPGVVFTFNEGSIYGNAAYIKTASGKLSLSTFGRTVDGKAGYDADEELCTVYTSTLTMEV